MEACLETVPQLLLKVYFTISFDYGTSTTSILYTSLGISVFSLALILHYSDQCGIINMHKARYFYYRLLLFVWRFAEITFRLTLLALISIWFPEVTVYYLFGTLLLIVLIKSIEKR